MRITRRQCLVLLTTVIGFPGCVIASWWKVPADEPFLCLSTSESRVINQLAIAAFPLDANQINQRPDPAEAKLDRFFDQLLFSMTEQNRDLLKLLLHALDTAPLLKRGRHFKALDQSESENQLQRWLLSSNHLLRGAVTSLVTLLGMGYCSHPTSSNTLSKLHTCGFGGAIGGFENINAMSSQ